MCLRLTAKDSLSLAGLMLQGKEGGHWSSKEKAVDNLPDLSEHFANLEETWRNERQREWHLSGFTGCGSGSCERESWREAS